MVGEGIGGPGAELRGVRFGCWVGFSYLDSCVGRNVVHDRRVLPFARSWGLQRNRARRVRSSHSKQPPIAHSHSLSSSLLLG